MADSPSADVSDAEILAVFAETDASPLRPADVADDLPAETDELLDRFDDLSEVGLLERDEDDLGGAAWYLTDEGEAALDDADGEVVTEVEAQATGTGTQSLPRDQETPESPPPEPGEETTGRPYEPPTDDLEAFDPPGTPEQKEQRREALRVAYEHLRDRGRVDRSELVDEVFPTAPGAYEEPSDGWWDEVVRPGFELLPGVEPADGDEVWQFDDTASERE